MRGSHPGAHRADESTHRKDAGPARRRGRRSWDDRGASAVEYALILVAFALGIIVVGLGLQKTIGSALADNVAAIESGAANAGCVDADADGDAGTCDGDTSGEGSGDGGSEGSTPTQPAGSTAIAPGSNASFTVSLSSGYSLDTPTSTACTYSPSITPSSATITVSETKSGSTTQSVKFSVSSGASHSQAISATCTFTKGSSTTTRSFSIWIS